MSRATVRQLLDEIEALRIEISVVNGIVERNRYH